MPMLTPPVAVQPVPYKPKPSYPYPGTQGVLPGTNVPETASLAPYVAVNAPLAKPFCDAKHDAISLDEHTFCVDPSKTSLAVTHCLSMTALGSDAVGSCLTKVSGPPVNIKMNGW